MRSSTESSTDERFLSLDTLADVKFRNPPFLRTSVVHRPTDIRKFAAAAGLAAIAWSGCPRRPGGRMRRRGQQLFQRDTGGEIMAAALRFATPIGVSVPVGMGLPSHTRLSAGFGMVLRGLLTAVSQQPRVRQPQPISCRRSSSIPRWCPISCRTVLRICLRRRAGERPMRRCGWRKMVILSGMAPK